MVKINTTDKDYYVKIVVESLPIVILRINITDYKNGFASGL